MHVTFEPHKINAISTTHLDRLAFHYSFNMKFMQIQPEMGSPEVKMSQKYVIAENFCIVSVKAYASQPVVCCTA